MDNPEKQKTMNTRNRTKTNNEKQHSIENQNDRHVDRTQLVMNPGKKGKQSVSYRTHTVLLI